MSDGECSDLEICDYSSPPPPPSTAAAVGPVEPDPGANARAGARKRKSPGAAAAPKPKKPPKDFGTNQAYVYYGYRESTLFWSKPKIMECMDGDDLRHCKHVIGELPQPRSMTLLDLECWIIKMFRLHPETQDLEIRGFFSERCPLVPDPGRLYLDWKTHFLKSDESWAAYVKKVKRRYGMETFVLWVNCSEIMHYRDLFKGGYHAYSQVAMGADPECTLTEVLPEQKSLSDMTLARKVYGCLEKNPAMTTREIVADLAKKGYHVQINRASAWRAKQKALELQYGTFYDAYDNVPRLLKDIKCNSRGNFVDFKDTEVADCKDFRVLHRIFWAFAPCIHAFVSCRPVLCIKGMPLLGKYRGVLLTALALDANDNYIPVAFAVIEGESKESWLWFLKNVKQAVVKGRPNVCIIHDHKKELQDAIDELQNNCNSQEALLWRDVKSRWCMEHLAENFLAHFGDKELTVLFKRLCQHNQPSKFVKTWSELDEFTMKCMAEKESGASMDMQQESTSAEHDKTEAQSPCNQPVPVEDWEEGNDSAESRGNDYVDSKTKMARSFSEWIRDKSVEKWSLLHDTKGARYGIMGTTFADVNNNHVLKGIRCLPLTAMVEATFRRLVDYFEDRRVPTNKAIGNPLMNFPERVQDDMNAKMQKVQMCQVVPIHVESSYGEELQKFKVQQKQRHVIVHLMNKAGTIRKVASCSCNKPQLHHKPCSHVIAVCCHIGHSVADYTSPYYSLSKLGGTWNGMFNADETLKCFKHHRNLISWDSPSWIPDKSLPTWIPDKRLEHGLPAFLSSG